MKTTAPSTAVKMFYYITDIIHVLYQNLLLIILGRSAKYNKMSTRIWLRAMDPVSQNSKFGNL
jgi:hypothetical protein